MKTNTGFNETAALGTLLFVTLVFRYFHRNTQDTGSLMFLVIVTVIVFSASSADRLENPPGENERSHIRQSFNK